MNFELIDIFTFINIAFIESCNVTILIVVKFRSFFQIRFIYVTKISNILSHSEYAISIYKIIASERNYIFKLKKIVNLVVYAHLIDNDIKAILIRNDNNTSVQISRNFRLRNLIEIDFSNALHIDTTHADFALKKLKYAHKSF